MCRNLKLPEDFDYQELARLTPGYVGADLMALCREAAMTAVNRVLLKMGWRQQIESKSPTKEQLTSEDQTCASVMDKEVTEQETTDIKHGPQEASKQDDLQV